jgi:hypothetical protein
MNGDASELQGVQVVLAVDSVPLRARIRKILEGAGIVPAVLRDSREIRHLSPEQVASAFIVLDTDDDVARLVQIVNDLYKLPYLGGRGSGTCILCVVGTDAIERNESLSFWEIDGGAAVFSVWTREDGEFEMIPKLIERIASPLWNLCAPRWASRNMSRSSGSNRTAPSPSSTWASIFWISVTASGQSWNWPPRCSERRFASIQASQRLVLASAGRSCRAANRPTPSRKLVRPSA